MAPEAKKKLFPNPFYLALVVVSTVFVMTALAYWIGPLFEQARIDHPDARVAPTSLALLEWMDRRGPVVLGVEFALMALLAFVAMAADDLFDAKRAKSARKSVLPPTGEPGD